MNNPTTQELITSLRGEILSIIDDEISDGFLTLREMLRYPLGLEKGSETTGKQIRPVILLMTCAALDGNWESALPAAAALELIHSFSLVHDDIQDKSQMRRGKESAWKKFGAGQAINLGDLMFMLGNTALLRLKSNFTDRDVLAASKILLDASIELISGQYLDLSFEEDSKVDLKQYWKMVDGKTGALFSAAFGLGALLAGKPVDAYCRLGLNFGRAFQVQDDWLGLWGEPDLTGKPIYSDLLERKKSYPIVYALNRSDRFREQWQRATVITENGAKVMLNLLTDLGIDHITQQTFEKEYHQSLSDFAILFPEGQNKKFFSDFLSGLFSRAT